MKKPYIIIGNGGHAKVLIDTLLLLGEEILGILDEDKSSHGGKTLGVKILGGDDILVNYPANEIFLVNGLGGTTTTSLRKSLYKKMKNKGYEFPSVVHPSAVVSSNASIAKGVQVMAGALVQAGCFIDENSIINTSASIDHDCSIGSHVHIAPGVVLSGDVTVCDNSHIGTGASIIQGITIANDVLVAAGAVVLANIEAGLKVKGIPAVPFSKDSNQ